MYSHSTRDVTNVNYDENLVVRDMPADDDAYSQALKESSVKSTAAEDKRNENQNKRHKIAVAKQRVEQEYADTMSFLNTLPQTGQPTIVTMFLIFLNCYSTIYNVQI